METNNFGLPEKEKDKWDMHKYQWTVINYASGRTVIGKISGINREQDEAYLSPFQGGYPDSIKGFINEIETGTHTVPISVPADFKQTTEERVRENCKLLNIQEEKRMIELRNQLEKALEEAAERERKRKRIIIP